MPRKFVKYLQPYNIFSCKYCHTHLASLSDIASKTVHPTDNTTYFFTRTVNIKQGKPERRKLLSGEAQIVDIFCNVCQGKGKIQGKQKQPLGWKYLKVADAKMSFKEGLSVIEKKYVSKQHWINK